MVGVAWDTKWRKIDTTRDSRDTATATPRMGDAVGGCGREGDKIGRGKKGELARLFRIEP